MERYSVVDKFSDIVIHYRKDLLNYANRLTRQTEQAEDLVSELYINARNRDDVIIHHPRKFVMHCLYLLFLDRKRNVRKELLACAQESEVLFGQYEMEMDEAIHTDTNMFRMMEAIATLAPRQKQTVLLTFKHGSMAAAARSIGMKEDPFKRSFLAARIKLKEKLL